MNVEKLLNIGSSRNIMDMIVSEINNNQKYFNKVFDIMLKAKYPISMRASWVISLCVEKNPSFMTQNHCQKGIAHLPKANCSGIKRSLLKIFYKHVFPENDEDLSKLVDLSLKWIQSEKEDIAVKMFSAYFLERLCYKEPDFKYELKAVLEAQLPYASKGFKSGSVKILKNLNNLN